MCVCVCVCVCVYIYIYIYIYIYNAHMGFVIEWRWYRVFVEYVGFLISYHPTNALCSFVSPCRWKVDPLEAETPQRRNPNAPGKNKKKISVNLCRTVWLPHATDWGRESRIWWCRMWQMILSGSCIFGAYFCSDRNIWYERKGNEAVLATSKSELLVLIRILRWRVIDRWA